jgi:ABC-2 type transport system permease protein
MSAWRAVWEVARRELVERSRSRELRVSLVLLLVLSVGGAIAAARLSGRTPTDKIGLVGARSLALEPAIRLEAKAAGRNVRPRRLADTNAADRAVHDGSVAVALIDGRRILVKTSGTGPAVRVVQDAVAAAGVLDRLRASGLTQAQALHALRPATAPVVVLAPRPPGYDRNQVLVSAGLLALFVVLVFFGQAVAQGVTEEKSSRVVELLLTTLSPRRLLTGKILGIGLLGLALLLIPAAGALAAGSLAGGAGLPPAAPGAIALILLWFVLGYIFYSVAFAAVGALVSRQEDLNTAMLPVNLVLIAAFYLAMYVVNTNPNGTVAQVAAFVPPASPMVVPARMVLGNMSVLACSIAIVLALLATAGLVVLAGRIYERAILRIGAPVKLRRLFARRPYHAHSTEDSRAQPRRSRIMDVALRTAAIALVLAGAAIGFSHPAGIALTVLGLLLVLVIQRRRGRGPRDAHGAAIREPHPQRHDARSAVDAGRPSDNHPPSAEPRASASSRTTSIRPRART